MTRRHTAFVALTLAIVVLLLAAARVADGPDTEPLEEAQHVVVVGVPGLTWNDVDPDTTPHLADATAHGKAGLLTARGGASFACPLDGWTTLGAGNRAIYSEIDQMCKEQRNTPVDPRTAMRANDDLEFGSEVGALGGAVPCTSVYGPAAQPAVSDGSGETDVRRQGDPLAVDSTTWRKRMQACPLTLIASPQLGHGDRRTEQVAEVDRLVGGLVAALDDSPDTRLLLVGVSDTPGVAPTMNVALSLNSTSSGELRSASTGRTAYVQLIDVAPTILDSLGLDAPSSMVGRPWQATDDDTTASDRIATFRDATEHADAHRTITTPTYWVWDALIAGFCLLAALLLARRRIAPWLHVAAIALGAAPIGTFLANLVPWWRADPAWLAYAAATVVATALVTIVACTGAWRRLRFGPPVAVAVITLVTLAVDAATGSTLQLGSALGYNPIVAGRFTGFGNMPFAVYAVAGVIVLATLMAGRGRRFVIATGAIGGFTLVVINGAPGVGADFGGVVALVPAVALVTSVAAGHRLTWFAAVAAVVGGAVVVSVVAVLDHLRPESAQTHLGRFVGQVMDGTAWRIIDRKLDANLHLLTHSPVAVLVPVLLAMCWWMLRSPDAPGRTLLHAHSPTMASAYVGVATVALVGTAINDSGIAVLVAAGAVAVPLWIGALDKVPE